MLKVTCIVGSARTNGSTAYLIDTLIKGLGNNGVDVRKYCIGELQIRYCKGCKKCYSDGICIQDYDVNAVVMEILSSDYVVIAAPSYWADVPGQLKTFFDRNTPYGDTNPNRVYKANKPIKGIAIAVRAGLHEAENMLLLDSITHYYGHLGIETVKRISVCQTDTLQDLLEKHQGKISEILQVGKQIANGKI
ncbi:MAG: flavodoxin family protein [Candidatus Fimenecus sp.]